MASDEELRERLRKMAGTYAPDVSNIAQVDSVNEKDCTCTLVDEDGQEYFNVRLKPITGKNKSLLQIPKKDSFVLAVRIESSEEWMVVACEEVEKVQLLVGSSEIVVTETDILLNGGKLGGLISINQLTAKLNEFVNIFNQHIHATPSGVSSPTSTQAKPFNSSDYEDDTIKH